MPTLRSGVRARSRHGDRRPRRVRRGAQLPARRVPRARGPLSLRILRSTRLSPLPLPDSLISVAAHARDLERLRQELKLERATLVGHSMGTVLAMHYLQEHPSRVRGMVLAGAIPPRSDTIAEMNRQAQAMSERPAVAEQMRLAGL